MNLRFAVRFVRPFATGASLITQSPRSILSLVCTAGAVAAAALAGITLAPSPASAATTIYNLGTLGGTISDGFAVNDLGQVAGYSATTGSTAYHAFRYDGTPGSGVMRDLGTLGGPSAGSDVNTSGQVAGSSQITGDTVEHAFRYDGTPGSGGVMHDLGTLGGTYSQGWGVNDAGQVAGWSYLTGDSYTSHAFRYDGTPGSGGIMRDLGTLGGTNSSGSGVNNAGQVAGYSNITGGPSHAIRYDGTPGSGGIMRDLGTLGGMQSQGLAINDAGQVTGWSNLAGDAVAHAFRYDGMPGSDGVMHDLGTLVVGLTSSGVSVNDAGQVVGWSQIGWSEITFNPTWHAFLYTGTPGVDGQMIDLDIWLDANNSAEGAKWTLRRATGISNTGWITGFGDYDPDGPGGIAAESRAYLLDASSVIVPEPSSFSLLSLAVSALLVRRRFRSRCRSCCETPELCRLLSSQAGTPGEPIPRRR